MIFYRKRIRLALSLISFSVFVCLPFKIEANHEKLAIWSLIEWCLTKSSYYPTSLHVLPVSAKDSDFIYDYQSKFKYLPTTLKPAPIQSRTTSVLFHPKIFLVNVTDSTHVLRIHQKIVHVGSSRRDCFIFTGNEKLIRSLFQKHPLSTLRQRVGYASDTKRFLIDPLIYNNGAPVAAFTLNNIPSPRKLGFNLRGKHFRVTGCPELPPHQYTISPNKSSNRKFDGTMIRLYDAVGSKFNYTYEMYAPEGQQYGSLLENGTWIGMIGDLTTGNFDFALVSGHLPRWYDLFDWTWTATFARILFLARKPSAKEIKWQAVFYPFEMDTWIGILSLYTFTSFCMFLFLRFQIVKWSLSHSIYWSFTTTFQISLEQNVKLRHGIKFLSMLWMIMTIVSGTMYKSNLASYLTIPRTDKLPSTFEELADKQEYKVILNHIGDAEYYFFQYSESPAIRKLKKRLEIETNPIICIHKVLLEKQTVCVGWTPFLMLSTAATATINLHQDAFKFSTQTALFASLAVPFKKDSSYVDTFALIISTIYEMGIYTKWEREVMDFNKKKGMKFVNSKQYDNVRNTLQKYVNLLGVNFLKSPLKISNLLAVYGLLVLGLGLSVVCFVFEVVWRWIYERKNSILRY
ncbi:unnamed protein product [Orchesella dallaii]|uniref:Ionotropic glutamate receptor L-glutamate and glycine-binding domain-containing protein n=1 Tax=Orchesella dallaii TaxID=48710 RepID=A0ABP1QNH0_9HEXA